MKSEKPAVKEPLAWSRNARINSQVIPSVLQNELWQTNCESAGKSFALKSRIDPEDEIGRHGMYNELRILQILAKKPYGSFRSFAVAETSHFNLGTL